LAPQKPPSPSNARTLPGEALRIVPLRPREWEHLAQSVAGIAASQQVGGPETRRAAGPSRARVRAAWRARAGFTATRSRRDLDHFMAGHLV
jgi:hypothetical protein